jgi:hypothetical protein
MASSATKQFVTPAGKPVYGVLAQFATPADLYHAAEKVRDAGYAKWDTFAPFPVHGLDEAMGVKRTRLPLVVGLCGLSMAVIGLLFQTWVATEGYGTVVQAKPLGSWQTFIPVTFEFGVLGTAFSSLFGMLIANVLPRWHHPLFSSDRFLKVSDDAFFVAIEAGDPKFDAGQIRAMFTQMGAVNVELITDDE